MDGNIIINNCIKTCDDRAAWVKFLQKTNDEGVQSANAPHKKNINDLHVEFGHPSQSITHATAKALGSKSLVLSSCVKIVLWAQPSYE